MKRILIAACMLLSSCTTIPKQAPLLSEELGNKIASLEKSHLSLLHAYFDQKRALVSEFVNDVWAPEFANDFFSNEQIQAAWNEIVKSNDTKDRLDFLIAIGPELQAIIDGKRQEFIQPLNELEAQIQRAIQDEFNLAKSANNTLTSFLTTAAKIDENRSRYMKMLNIPEDRISSIIYETDKILTNLVAKTKDLPEKANELKDYEKKANEALEKLKQLKDQISKKN